MQPKNASAYSKIQQQRVSQELITKRLFPVMEYPIQPVVYQDINILQQKIHELESKLNISNPRILTESNIDKVNVQGLIEKIETLEQMNSKQRLEITLLKEQLLHQGSNSTQKYQETQRIESWQISSREMHEKDKLIFNHQNEISILKKRQESLLLEIEEKDRLVYRLQIENEQLRSQEYLIINLKSQIEEKEVLIQKQIKEMQFQQLKDNSKNEYSEKERQITQLKFENKELKVKLQFLDNLQAQLEEKNQQMIKLQFDSEKSKQLEKVIDKLRKEIEERDNFINLTSKQESSSLDPKLKQLQVQNEEQQEQLRNMNREYQKLKVTLEQSEGQNQFRQREQEQLGILEDKIRKLNKANSNLQKQIEDQEEQFRNRYKDLTLKYQQLQDQFEIQSDLKRKEGKQNDFRQFEFEIDRLNNVVKEQYQSMEDQKAQISSLKSLIKKKDLMIDEQRDEIQSLKRKVQSEVTEAKLIAAQKNEKELETQCNKLDSEIKELKRQLKQANQKLNDEQEKISGQLEQQIQQTQNQMNRTQNDLNLANEELTQKRADQERLLKKIKLLEKAQNDNDLKLKLEFEDLQSRFNRLEAQNKDIKFKCEQYEIEIDELRVIEEKYLDLQTREIQFKIQIDRLNEQLRLKEIEFNKIKQENADLNNELSQRPLNKEIKEITIDTSEIYQQKLQQIVESLYQDKLRKQNEEILSIKRDLMEKNDEIRNLQIKLNSIDQLHQFEILSKADEIVKQKLQLETLSEGNSIFQKNLKEENISLKNINEELQNKQIHLISRISILESELEQLKKRPNEFIQLNEMTEIQQENRQLKNKLNLLSEHQNSNGQKLLVEHLMSENSFLKKLCDEREQQQKIIAQLQYENKQMAQNIEILRQQDTTGILKMK